MVPQRRRIGFRRPRCGAPCSATAGATEERGAYLGGLEETAEQKKGDINFQRKKQKDKRCRCAYHFAVGWEVSDGREDEVHVPDQMECIVR
jgi:hypothetical protein